MSISGTTDFDPGKYNVFFYDISPKETKEVTPFQVEQDTIRSLGGNYFGNLYVAPGNVPLLDPEYKPILTLDNMTPELFAKLMIRDDLNKIRTSLDLLIKQATEGDKSIDLLELLKIISEAIKNLEDQIEKAKDLDAKGVRTRLVALAKQSEKAYQKLHKTMLLLNLSEEQLKELSDILRSGMELPKQYQFLKDAFGALLETRAGKTNLSIMFNNIIKMKESAKRIEEKEDRMGKFSSGNSGEIQVENDIGNMSRDIQGFNHAMKLLGIDPELISSITTLITQMAFKNYLEGNDKVQKIVIDLLQDESAMYNMFVVDSYSFRGGYGINDLEKQIIGIIVTMTFTLLYMELQKDAELDKNITDDEKKEMKKNLGDVMANLTANEIFKDIMGANVIKHLQSKEFLSNIISTAKRFHDRKSTKEEMTISSNEMNKIIEKLLENKQDTIEELLKNLKMLKAMYAAILAMIGGSSEGGNILELLKGLKAMMAGQEEIPLQQPGHPV